MGKAAKEPATYEDFLAAPADKKAQLIEGELVLSLWPDVAP
jgi:hypothetical protein